MIPGTGNNRNFTFGGLPADRETVHARQIPEWGRFPLTSPILNSYGSCLKELHGNIKQ